MVIEKAGHLRILLFTTSLMAGGAEIQVYLIAMELRRRGHDVLVVSMRDPEALDAELVSSGVPVESLSMRRGVANPMALFQFASIIRRFRPDVIHSHMIHANLLSRLARPLAPVPVLISTAHNISEGARWRELAYRATDRLVDLTTNVCKKCVENFVAVGATPRDRIRYVPNGLDLSRFRHDDEVRRLLRASLDLDESTFLWLAVGRLEEQKDYPNLLSAVAALRSSTDSGSPLVVLVAGEGPLLSELVAERVRLGLPEDSVRFLGQRDDIPDLMSAADAYVMSSAWEGLPMVLLEAGAAGLPVVATAVGGNEELVVNRVTGMLVPPADAPALANAMQGVMDLTYEERQALGHNATINVTNSFSIETVVDLWLQIYKGLLSTKDR